MEIPSRYLKEDLYKLYLSAIGLPSDLKLNPCVETLYIIAEKHPTYIAYQNFTLHYKEKPHLSLKFSELIERLCVKKLGGFCYEHAILLYHIL